MYTNTAGAGTKRQRISLDDYVSELKTVTLHLRQLQGSRRPWQSHLPSGVLAGVFVYLDVSSRGRSQVVCRYWCRVGGMRLSLRLNPPSNDTGNLFFMYIDTAGKSPPLSSRLEHARILCGRLTNHYPSSLDSNSAMKMIPAVCGYAPLFVVSVTRWKNMTTTLSDKMYSCMTLVKNTNQTDMWILENKTSPRGPFLGDGWYLESYRFLVDGAIYYFSNAYRPVRYIDYHIDSRGVRHFHFNEMEKHRMRRKRRK